MECSRVKYGLLHNHTMESRRDSAMSVQALVDRAKELGAPAVALTDHGVMTGYIDFARCCEEAGIKPVVGVEAYIEEGSEGRKHLILMSKNDKGFQALSKFTTATQHRLANGFARGNKELLMQYFGPGSEGHGNVIATSACVQGVLASIVLANRSVDDDINKLREQQDAFLSPQAESYAKNCWKRDALMADQSAMSVEIAALKKAAKKSTQGLYRRATTGKDEAKRLLAKKEYEEEERKKAEAAEKLAEVNAAYEKNAAVLKNLKAFIAADEKQIAKWMQIERRITAIRERYVDDASLNNALLSEADWYSRLFGEGNFYIELQYHGLEIEKAAYPKLAWVAQMTGLPVVAANDAHIPDNSADSVLARAIAQSTRYQYERWYAPDAADYEVCVKDDAELSEALLKILPEETVQEAMENVGEIVSKCEFHLNTEKHYPKFVAPNGKTPEEYLREMTYAGIAWRYPDGDFTDYDRLEYELNIICSMGYADYFCIVEDFLRYARVAGKLYLDDPEEQKLALTFDTERIAAYVKDRPGETVGPGRGSAAGSLVCYMTGITNINPLTYGLLFERFLNPERVSMPDIDCDIESNVRPYAIEYVKHKYGEATVCRIMSKSEQTGKAALLTAAKTYALSRGYDAQHYVALEKLIAKKAEELTDDPLHLDLHKIADDFVREVKSTGTKVPEKISVTGLKNSFAGNDAAQGIIHFALCIEGTVLHNGQHAAGIIIADGAPVDDYIPLIMSNKSMLMTSCDMIQAEEIGLLKMDFLGLINLTVITNTVRQIYKDTGKLIDMDRIPMDDADVYREIFAKANTNSVFQFESDGMKGMLKGFRPETIFDLTLLVAMFRPGPMQFLSDVIAVKNGQQPVTYLTPELEPILKNTYGAIAYQEQVQEIFKSLAGYSLGQADMVRRAMSKKKEKVLKAERQAFIYGDPERKIEGCKKRGISEETANDLFDEVMDFARYAFNKSHAACYAVVAYQTAWLKHHYPLQYMAAVLNSSDFDGIQKLCGDMRYMQIPFEAPDVNVSGAGFTIYDNAVYYGLSKIKGLGAAQAQIEEERKKNGPFRSIADFVIRTWPDAKTFEKFVRANAFRHLCDNRQALLIAWDTVYAKAVKSLKDYKKKLTATAEPEKQAKIRKSMADKEDAIRQTQIDTSVCNDEYQNLKNERELLGDYFTGHPMDHYESPRELKTVTISQALERGKKSSVRVAGIITEYTVKARRADGRPMAFFTLSDQTGNIPICCFTEPYASYSDLLAEDAVVKISGEIMVDTDNDAEEPIRKISVKTVEPLKPVKDMIMIMDTDPFHWMDETKDKVVTYANPNGNPACVFFESLQEIWKTDLVLNPLIVTEAPVRCSMTKTR